MFATVGKERGCGASRDYGGVYLEVGLSKFGAPLEDFLFDPVIACDWKKLGLSPRQPLLMPHENGRVDVVDWVGETHYPNPSDFLEEVRRLGLSRKLELSHKQYELLSSESRILIVLPRAYIHPQIIKHASISNMNLVDYPWRFCPKDQHESRPSQGINTIFEEPCAGYLWQRTDHGSKPILEDSYPDGRYVERVMPAFTYQAVRSCDAFLDADPAMFQPGFVASFQIGRLVVVNDPDGKQHEEKLDKLKAANLRVDLVEA